MEVLQYKVQDFEGPLDVLLTLISKNKMNICDIEISLLLEQYIEQIELMKQYDMDIASEFLEMAARLVHIKTVSLLPKHEEEEKELKRELTGQLLEYKQCKEIAALLSQMMNFNRMVREPEKIPVDMRYSLNHPPELLLKAYMNAAGRGKRFLPPKEERFNELVVRRFVSVSSQVSVIFEALSRDKKINLEEFFATKHDSSERVAAFLAVLELIKEKKIRIDEEKEDVILHLV
ncbi:MAG: serine protease [Ruminococcaceae bacterium]|nr:serine protease [Oscillospiraceae bacterium]